MNLQEELSALVSAHTGIAVTRGCVERALQRYVTRRAAELQIPLRDFVTVLAEEEGIELERLSNAITVGHSWFFRDPGQLSALQTLVEERARSGRPVRVWIPGCSTGEDAYSVALIAERAGRSVEILATDLNSNAVEHAKRGLYGPWSVRDLDPRFTEAFHPRMDGRFEVDLDLRERVAFAQHNLLERPPAPKSGGAWDIVLCRNVLMYFERKVALGVLETMTHALGQGGYLVLGASEVVCGVPSGLEARYVASRLVFARAEAHPGFPLRPGEGDARDWLLAPAGTEDGQVFSAFPESGAAIAKSVPPPPPAPVEVEGRLALGHRLLEAGDAVGARGMYLEALERAPTRADTHLYAGVAEYLCGDLEPASRDLRTALELDPNLWPAAFYLALCYENGGHPAEALLAFQQVVDIDDRDRAKKCRLGCVFETWRVDLCELARHRVSTARAALFAGRC